MQKTIIYIFIFLIASNSSFFQQFYKLPVLVQHFQEHQEINKVGFIDFLATHYFGDHEDDGDSERDMQLPFKTTCGHSFHMVFVPLNKEIVYIPLLLELPGSKITVYRPNLFPNPALSSLFRPPLA